MRTVFAVLVAVMLVACGEVESDGADLAGGELSQARKLGQMPTEPTEPYDPEPVLETDAGVAAPDAAAQPAPDAGAVTQSATPATPATADAGATVVPVPAFYDGRPMHVVFEATGQRLRFQLTIHANAQGPGLDTCELVDELTGQVYRNGTGRIQGWPTWVGGSPDGWTFALLFNPETETIESVNVAGVAINAMVHGRAFQVASFVDQD